MMLFLLAAPVQLMGSRQETRLRDDDDDEDQTAHMLPGQGITMVNDGGNDDEDGTKIFLGGVDSEPVMTKASEFKDADVKNVMEIQTKLKFTSNKKTLANPELVEKILEDIKEQQEKLPGLKFIFCAHVGTTAIEKITQTRPGFMEGRVESFKDALQPDGTMPGVSGVIEDEFMHFEAARFAGLVMWAYGGDMPPECAKSDLNPPSP